MDAYAFATAATPEGVARLLELVDDGTLRVAVPLAGEHAAYAAAATDSAEELSRRMDAVRELPGLEGVSVLVAASPEASDPASRLSIPPLGPTPTWAPPQGAVGFALLSCSPDTATGVYELAYGVTGVIGCAVAGGGLSTVLVELTGSDAEAFAPLFDELGAIAGVESVAASVGLPELGRGFAGG